MRQTFTFRLDDDLVSALAARVEAGDRSRNWVINQALRSFLDGAAAGDTRTGMSPDTEEDSATARAASAGGPRGAQPPQPPSEPPHGPETASGGGVTGSPSETPRAPGQGGGRHLHRLTVEVPGTRRYIEGIEYATFACQCGKVDVERKVPK
jgi:hypothetical protein